MSSHFNVKLSACNMHQQSRMCHFGSPLSIIQRKMDLKLSYMGRAVNSIKKIVGKVELEKENYHGQKLWFDFHLNIYFWFALLKDFLKRQQDLTLTIKVSGKLSSFFVFMTTQVMLDEITSASYFVHFGSIYFVLIGISTSSMLSF